MSNTSCYLSLRVLPQSQQQLTKIIGAILFCSLCSSVCPYLPTYCYSLLLEGRFWQQRAFVLFSGKQPRSAARQERQTVKKRELLKPWLRKKVNFWWLLFLTAEFDGGKVCKSAARVESPPNPPTRAGGSWHSHLFNNTGSAGRPHARFPSLAASLPPCLSF